MTDVQQEGACPDLGGPSVAVDDRVRDGRWWLRDGPGPRIENAPAHCPELADLHQRALRILVPVSGGLLVREDDADAAIKPTDVIHRVRVEDNPSDHEAAVPQPAVFTLEVLRKEEGMPLGEWLRSVSRSDGDRISEAQVAGTSGYLIELDRYIAPGRFYYIASGQRVYRLTPLGEASADVLASFVLTG